MLLQSCLDIHQVPWGKWSTCRTTVETMAILQLPSALPPVLWDWDPFQPSSLALPILTALLWLVCCLVLVWCLWFLFIFLNTFSVCLKLRKKNKKSSLFPSFTVSSAGLSSGWNASDGIDFFEMDASPSLIGVLFLIFIWLVLRTFLFLQLGGISPFSHCFVVENHDKITSLLFKRK